MKCTLALLKDVAQSIKMALVSIHIVSSRKLNVLLFTRTPLTESGIQLIDHVSTVDLNNNDKDLPLLPPKRPSELGLHG